MGDDRKPDYEYEMAPQTEPTGESDVEKGKMEEAAEDKKDVEKQPDPNEWGGLNKAELLEVADTPFWNWTRNILLILFWVGWVAMLVAAIVIVVKVPRCPEVEWWEKSVFYRVFPQSYKDTDGDGYGDLQGLTGKLDYIQSIGASVLVLSSIYENEVGGDIGQAIVNFTNVDPMLGTVNDFEDLMTAATEKEIKVVLEFVPNHSSDQHPWFINSKSRTGNFSDFYVWEDCGDGSTAPNDWLNKYGDSAWTYDAERGQCYYHYLLPTQPDLNYNNNEVKAAMMDALEFWFNKNVDGFVLSGVDYIFEPTDMDVAIGNRRRRAANATEPAPAAGTDAPVDPTMAEPEPTTAAEPEPEPSSSSGSGSGSPQYSCISDACSSAQMLLHGLLAEFRDVFNDNSYLGKYRLMITETELEPEEAIKQFGNDTREADLVLYRGFAKALDGDLTGETVQTAVSQWLSAKDAYEDLDSRWNTWTLGDEHMSRLATRVGEKFASCLNFILLTLPGTPISYYAEELGTPDLTNLGASMDPVADVTSQASRDPERGPMYWKNTTEGGFTNATAWLPLPSDPKYSAELQHNLRSAVQTVFKELAGYHSEPSMTAGDYNLVSVSSTIYAYHRQFPDWPGYLVVTNFGDSPVKLDFDVKKNGGEEVITRGVFKLSSTGWEPKEKKVTFADFTIEPAMSVLIET